MAKLNLQYKLILNEVCALVDMHEILPVKVSETPLMLVTIVSLPTVYVRLVSIIWTVLIDF